MDDGKPEWDEGRATALIGALVLVGITYEAAGGEHHEQFFGTVEAANKNGISLRLGGSREGDTYNLPPDPSAFFPAQPGDYRLRATGEILTDPDYTSTWNICARND